MLNKIINNAFSTKMLQEDILGDCINVEFQIISEDEFRQAIKESSKIIIGHEDTAKFFGVEMNRETIQLHEGDVLFVCEANAKHGGRLPSGTEFLEQMGTDFFFRFFRICVKS